MIYSKSFLFFIFCSKILNDSNWQKESKELVRTFGSVQLQLEKTRERNKKNKINTRNSLYNNLLLFYDV